MHRITTPQLLVSVRNSLETRQAIAGGADWIDLKDPHQGPLGPVSVKVANKVAEIYSGQRPLSAAAGELRSWHAQGNRTILTPSSNHDGEPGNERGKHLLDIPGIRLLKLGLAGYCDTPCWQDLWSSAQAQIHTAQKSLVAVIYADWQKAASPQPKQIVEHAIRNPCKYLLIDTFCKTKGALLDCLRIDELAQILEQARKASIRTVVAGSLSLASLPHLLSLPIDLIAIRGAACTGGRNGILQRDRIEQFQSALRALPWEL